MKPLNANEQKAQALILEQVNNTLDLLQKHLQKYCDEVAPMYNGGQKVTSVPMAYIDQSIKIVKENMAKGAKVK
jgi:hypothetical protein